MSEIVTHHNGRRLHLHCACQYRRCSARGFVGDVIDSAGQSTIPQRISQHFSKKRADQAHAGPGSAARRGDLGGSFFHGFYYVAPHSPSITGSLRPCSISPASGGQE